MATTVQPGLRRLLNLGFYVGSAALVVFWLIPFVIAMVLSVSVDWRYWGWLPTIPR